jgi:hypothetical protein
VTTPYYDRAGKPITIEEMASLEKQSEAFRTYRQVARTGLPWGGLVSTVWIGIDMRLRVSHEEDPLIFESMVFQGRAKRVFDADSIGALELDQLRYASETEALKGHNLLVMRWREAYPYPGQQLMEGCPFFEWENQETIVCLPGFPALNPQIGVQRLPAPPGLPPLWELSIYDHENAVTDAMRFTIQGALQQFFSKEAALNAAAEALKRLDAHQRLGGK